MKICTKCKIEKEDSDFRFEKKYNRLRSWCRQCDKDACEKWRRSKGIKPQTRRPPDLIPDTKICSRCNIEKPKDYFRIRVERRHGNFRYLNPTCKKCDTKISKEYYKKWRQTEEGRKRNNEWAKKAYKKRRNKAIAYMKKKRQTPEYKANMKAYREKRKDIIYKQEVITKRRYHEKNKVPITDKYVVNLLRTQGYGTTEELLKNKELIEIKRGEILLSRIKSLKFKKKNELSGSS